MKKAIRLTIVLTTLVISSGCAKTFQNAYFPDQALTVEDSEKARIYLICDTFLGLMIHDPVIDGEKFVGMVGPTSYLCWERQPGRTTICVNPRSKSTNTSELEIEVAKGEVYYLRLHRLPGPYAPIYGLELINSKKGKRLVKSCKPPKKKS